MKRQQTFTDIEYGNRKRRTKMDEFLEAMDAIIEWPEWCALVEPYYPSGERGRPPRGVEIMLRMYLLGVEKQESIANHPNFSQIDWRINQRKPRRATETWKQGEAARWHKIFNAQKSRVRCKVEYPFLIIKRIFHYDKVRYRGIQKNRTQAYTLCALANLYMLRRSGFVGAT